MEWLAKFVRSKTASEDESNFMGAGCLFTSGHYVLAAFQPKKKMPIISGFGGKRHGTETYIQTALRETLEELFDVKPVSVHLIELIETNLTPSQVLKNKPKDGLYYTLHYSFDDLKQILKYASPYCVDTPLYEEWPTSIQRLIFHRNIEKASEVSHICLLPLTGKITIDDNFKMDIYSICGLKGPSE